MQFKTGTETHDASLRADTEAAIKAIQDTARNQQEAVVKTLLDIVARVTIVRRNEAEVKA